MSQFEVEEESLCNEHLDSKKRKLMENVEDSDQKDTKKAKVEEEKEKIDVENESQIEKLMQNPNMWHLCDQIFGYLDHKTIKTCRKVSEFWNKFFDVKFIREFGNRYGIYHKKKNYGYIKIKKKVSAIIPGLHQAVKKYGLQSSIEDLREVKDSLRKLLTRKGRCCSYPVHEVAKNGSVKLMELILNTSYDINHRDITGNMYRTPFMYACINGRTETVQLMISASKDCNIDLNCKSQLDHYTAFQWACKEGRTETVQLMISASKDFDIDLNATDNWKKTGLYLACENYRTDTVRAILKNWKEFGIDIKAEDRQGYNPLEVTSITIPNYRKFQISQYDSDEERMCNLLESSSEEEEDNEEENIANLKLIEEMLKNEYSKMDVKDTEHGA